MPLLEPIKIALFEDHPMTAMGLQVQLEQYPSFHVVGVFDALLPLYHQLNTVSVDLLIADVIVPGAEGLSLFSEVTVQYPNLPIIAFTALNNPSLKLHLHNLGIRGFVNKRKPMTHLLEAIETVISGGSYFPDLPGSQELKTNSEPIEPLSVREKEILNQIAKGLLTKEIAAKLGISMNTVMAHRTKLFQKLKVQNLGELLLTARNLGYIDD